MKYIEGISRVQKTLLPDCIEDYVTENNPVRVIDAFVDSLNMKELGFKRAVNNTTGRPSYDPRDILKLYIYGYLNGIRSSRKLMRESRRNIELFYLINRLEPDFRTIADFRKDNATAIRKVFSAFTKLCLKAELYGCETMAVDGTKIRAVNSKDNSFTPDVLKKKITNIDKKIDGYLEELDRQDEMERDEEADPEAVKKLIDELRKRKDKYNCYLKELEETGEKQLLSTDRDAKRMKSKDGFHCAYNIQSVVDDKNHMIAAFEVENSSADGQFLYTSTAKAKKELGTDTMTIMADKGYDNRKDILECIMNGVVPQVLGRYDKEQYVFRLDYKENEIDDKTKNSVKPEDIAKCLHAGVLPAIYENTNISLESYAQETMSCFLLNDDGTVTCPTGNIMHKTRNRGVNTVFACKEACRKCTTRCKSSDTHKVVSFGPNTKYVPVMMYGNAENFTKLPQGEDRDKSYTHTLYRKDYAKPKALILTVKIDPATARKRKSLVEHPFGTIKRSLGVTYTLMKGKTKVSADIGLGFLAYNMIRAVNILGTQKLIEIMGV